MALTGIEAVPPYIQSVTKKFSYDFAIEGGAIANITLRGGSIPRGAIPVQIVTNITSAVTGVSGTLAALTLESAGDLQAAHAVSDMTTQVAGVSAYAGNGSALSIGDAEALIVGSTGYGANTTFVLTADRNVIFTPSVHVVTGGKFDIYITYLPS